MILDWLFYGRNCWKTYNRHKRWNWGINYRLDDGLDCVSATFSVFDEYAVVSHGMSFCEERHINE